MGKTYSSHYCQYKVDLTEKTRKIETVVLGIGNILLGDEGVGVHVIHELQKMDFPSSILFIDGATAGFKLLTLFENYRHSKFIIIDALMIAGNASREKSGGNKHSEVAISKADNTEAGKQKPGLEKPRNKQLSIPNKGDIYMVPLSDFYRINQSAYLSDGFISFHQTSLIDILNFFYISHRIKIPGCFIGINISKTLDINGESNLSLSMGLSREIKTKIPKIIDIVKKHL